MVCPGGVVIMTIGKSEEVSVCPCPICGTNEQRSRAKSRVRIELIYAIELKPIKVAAQLSTLSAEHAMGVWIGGREIFAGAGYK
jgi:hypothetical protein